MIDTSSSKRSGPDARRRRLSLSAMTSLGLLGGIACGLLFGELTAPLARVGDAFVGLLRMTVLPFIVVSMIASLGKLTVHQSRRLAIVGGAVTASLWAIGLFTVAALTLSFPDWSTGSFFSVAVVDPPPPADFLEIFIPSNFFTALTENHVPGVILLCACVGVALSQIRRRRLLLAQLDVLATALVRVSSAVTWLSPIGVFAISASTAGTMTLGELNRLQAYLLSYTAGGILLGLVLLPMLIAAVTPFRYRDVFMVTKTAMLTAFATGKLIIVLPLLTKETERLFAELEDYPRGEAAAPRIEALYPLAYAFPHVGKLLSLLFIPFVAWFLGHPLGVDEYPSFLVSGLFSNFGGPLLATPFLLDLMHLPHDMFQLFLLAGVLAERVGDALGVMHLVAFVLITTSFLTGHARFSLRAVLRALLVCSLLGLATVFSLRAVLNQTTQYVETEEQVLAEMQRLDDLVEVRVITDPVPNPAPLEQGESLLDRVHRRGVLRVGFNDDKLPFAFFTSSGRLVGFDISMAEALASDLGVSVEFVRFDRRTLAEQLESDHFDVVMSGLAGTLERSTAMEHTSSYLDVTLSLVVPDYRVREFGSIERIRAQEGLRIGFIDLSRGFVNRLQQMLPNAELVALSRNRDYFDGAWRELDALLISAESGAAYTLRHPDFEAVIPDGIDVTLPLFYAVGGRDRGMREFLEHWIALRKGDGSFADRYEHWVLGHTQRPATPRWSVLRDVLGWVD